MASGWTSKNLSDIYASIEKAADQMPDGSTERGCLLEALKSVELADVYCEKRQSENA